MAIAPRASLRPFMGPLAAALAVLTFVFFGAGSSLAATVPHGALPASLLPVQTSWWFRLTPVYGQAFAVVGAFIVWRRPGNRIGWVTLGIGALWALYQFATGFAVYAIYGGHGAVPGANAVASLVNWEWMLPTVLMLFVLPFLFPDGHPPSLRWVPLGWIVTALVAVTVVGVALLPGVTTGNDVAAQTFNALVHFVLVTCGVVAAASVVARYRNAGLEVRQQLKWFVAAYIVLAVVAICGFVLTVTVFHESLSFAPVFEVLIPVAMIGVALSVAVAIFRYRLYDIDVFIRRTLVYGALVVLIGLLYLILVVTVGTRLGTAHEADPAIPFVVAAIVAIAFQPVRTRLTRAANRLVYGRRATPYEVLSRFGEQVSTLYGGEDLSQRMARLLADGTGADRAEVWLRIGNELRNTASWPSVDGVSARVMPMADDALPAIPQAAESAPVSYQGDPLGALAVVKREPLTTTEQRLLHDLARQASVVLKNARLTAELQMRLGELQASRQRLVTAQDEERRRLERDLHDGAQQNLVALKIQLGLARTLASRQPERVGALLEQLTADADEAIQVLRRFSHGIYPPVLAERGLEAALQAHARLMPLPVRIEVAEPRRRYDRQVESAVYFCALEALQNVVKHAHASAACVAVSNHNGWLAFSVTDDGVGLDSGDLRQGAGMQNMSDRLAALGGELRLEAAAPHGTRITGSIPVELPEAH